MVSRYLRKSRPDDVATGNPIPDVDHRVHGGGWLDACAGDVRERIAACLSALPLAIEVETPSGVVGMVHADFPYDDWQAIHGATFSPEDEGLPMVRRPLSNAVFPACPQCTCGGPWTYDAAQACAAWQRLLHRYRWIAGCREVYVAGLAYA